MKKHYDKLVRDGIPAIIEARGSTCRVRTLDEAETIQRLVARGGRRIGSGEPMESIRSIRKRQLLRIDKGVLAVNGVSSVKTMLFDERILGILAQSVYEPTHEKMMLRANEWSRDANTSAFGWFADGLPVCAMVVKRWTDDRYEILSIATEPSHRGRGHARNLVEAVFNQLGCAALLAETDDDAVEFYRKAGFDVESLGERYPGIIRYRCVLRRTS